jgi:tetratricopeptide (TPR) repeat protein
VAEKLKVQHAIEGSVQRSGDRIRIRAQLVTVPDGYQVWSESYDGLLSDLFGVQNRIAHAIAAKLRESGGSAISTPRTLQGDIDPEAYRLYLQGRHLADRWSRENFGQALASYREAIRREPEFAAAYAALAELYSLVDHRPALMDIEPAETYRLGIQFATQALRIDPHCAEALAALGHIYVHTGEFAEAERHLLAALRSNPNSSQATLWYAVLLNVTNRREEAREQRAKAVELEPLSVQTSVVMMAAANRDGDFEDAVVIGRSTVALLPDSTEPWVFLAVNLAFMGRFAEAHVALSRAAANGAPARVLDAERVRVLALEGRNEEARGLLMQIERDPVRKPAPVVLMRAWATMDVDRALFWMDEMMRESPDYARVNLTMPPHPLYRELRRHHRYREARRQLGLPLLEDGTR